MKNTKPSRIAIVGCGNIGMRHLEGLLKLNRKTIISIVEPRLSAQKLAQSIYNKYKTNKKNQY